MITLNNLISDEIGAIFTDALSEVISKTTSFSLDVLASEQDADLCEITGAMNLNGMKGAMIFISVNEADMRILCSYMIGVEKGEVTREDMLDALCEFVNMTAGNAKLRLYGTELAFALSSPFTICGDNMSIITKKRNPLISRTLGDGNISIKLKIICA